MERKTLTSEPENQWVHRRKVEWNEHIDRMEEQRIVKVARDSAPKGKRSVGWPMKRWKDNLHVR